MIADGVEERAVVVERLREVPGALERGRDAQSDRVSAVDRRVGRAILVRIVEEQFVVATGLADRAAHRVAVDVALVDRFGVAVLLVHPAVLVPVGVDLVVVGRSAEAIRAGLRDGRDLNTARPSVLRLVALRQHLDLGDRLDVHVEHRAVVARVHGRDAVHHDVVLSDAAETCAASRRAAGDDAGRQGGKRGKAAEVSHRQVLDLRRGDRERPFAARRLDEGRLGGDVDRFFSAARFEGERLNGDAVAAAGPDARALHGAEAVHRDFHGVDVRGDVREDVVTGGIGNRRHRLRAARFADEHDSRAGDDPARAVFNVTENGPGRDLSRGCGRAEQQGDQARADHTASRSDDHGTPPPSGCSADYRSTCKVRHVMGYKSLIGVTRPAGRVNRHFALRNTSLQCETTPSFPAKTAHFRARHLLHFHATRAVLPTQREPTFRQPEPFLAGISGAAASTTATHSQP